MTKHVLIVAGDPSADRHGAALVRALRERVPDLRVSALGGMHLKAVANDFLFPLVGLGGFGFWEPLAKLPQLWKARQIVRRRITHERPDVVVPMDYYGFNIHVARLAKSAAIPVLYYISPQVWASRPTRIASLKAAVDEMLLILPFEQPLYAGGGVPSRFVGHPLLENMPEPQPPSSPRTIGLLPGSRRGVVARHVPILLEMARQLKARFSDLHFVLFRPAEIEPDDYAEELSRAPFVRLVCEDDYVVRRSLTLAIGVSGTASLENMLLGIPMIIMYKLSALTYAIARRLVRISYVGMPNILANRPVVPELLQNDATPERLTEAAAQFLADPERLRRTRDELLGLRRQLEGGASKRAAEAILERLGTAQRPVMQKVAS